MRRAFARVEPNGYDFVPLSVESFGHLGLPAIKLLNDVGDETAGPGGVMRAFIVAEALREISTGSCRTHSGEILLLSRYIGYPPACWLGTWRQLLALLGHAH
jgi:hypothetical protein